jgi:hypothetical protein
LPSLPPIPPFQHPTIPPRRTTPNTIPLVLCLPVWLILLLSYLNVSVPLLFLH